MESLEEYRGGGCTKEPKPNYWHWHHQNDSYINTGSDVNLFAVTFTVGGSHKTLSTQDKS